MKPNDDEQHAQQNHPQVDQASEAASAKSAPTDHESDSRLNATEPWTIAGELPDIEPPIHLNASTTNKKKSGKRRLFAALTLLVITVSSVLFLFNNLNQRSVKVKVDARQPNKALDATARSDKAPDDVTAEAIAEVRSAISNPNTGSAQSSLGNSVVPRANENATASSRSSVLPSDMSEKPADIERSKNPTSEVSKRNPEQSIRFTTDQDEIPIRKADLVSPTTVAPSNRLKATGQNLADGGDPQPARFSRSDARARPTKPTVVTVVLPSFGSILPVRTLGKIYTLRSGSSIRLELTRYVSGEGWSLSKGTVLIGQVSGSERDRAYIAVTGFIDPSRDRFVNLNGEMLGDDGGSGIHGKFHKLSSGWSRAFARVGSAAVNVAGAVAGSRISGQPVIITDVGARTISPVSYEVDSSLLSQSRGFVEVAAGTPGFVMVTTLPADVKGIDAEPDHLAHTSDATIASDNQSGPLTQEELAQLLTSGDPKLIREALPKMSTSMRRLAETVLAESSTQPTNRD
jgi:hypothetical protein